MKKPDRFRVWTALVAQFLKDHLPIQFAYLNELFVLYTPERALRSGDELQISSGLFLTAFGQRNIVYRGRIYWNSLPIAIKASPSTDSFKQAIKKYPGFD